MFRDSKRLPPITERAVTAFSALMVCTVLFFVASTGEYFSHRQAVLSVSNPSVPTDVQSGSEISSERFSPDLSAEAFEEIVA